MPVRRTFSKASATRACCCDLGTSTVTESKCDVGGHVHVREQGVALEHRVHRPLVWRGPGLVDPVDEDGAAVDRSNPAIRRSVVVCRIPTARAKKEFAILDPEVDVIDRQVLPEVLGQIDQFDDAAHEPGESMTAC